MSMAREPSVSLRAWVMRAVTAGGAAGRSSGPGRRLRLPDDGQCPRHPRSATTAGGRWAGSSRIFFRGTIGVFSTDNIKPLLVGGGATGIGAIFDDEVADWIADPEHGFGTALEDGAAPAVVGAAVAVLFATGRVVDGPRYRAMTYDLMHAFLINAGYTTLLKEVVQRERPNGDDQLSFPSGHASNAFTLAAVAERHYGWKVGLPAYTLASLVAVSRLQRNKHYLSDVMAGATLGYIVGRTVVRVNGQALDAPRGAHLSVSPVISRRTRAVVARVEF